MWYSKSKCWWIEALIMTNHKRLKVILVSKVRNFDPSFVVLKLVEFSLFKNFFPDLAKFWNLNVFSLFDFPYLNNFLDFLAYSILFSPTRNPLVSLLLSFFLKTSLLLLFLLKADLLLSFVLRASLFSDLVVFSIEVSETTIWMKPWINC